VGENERLSALAMERYDDCEALHAELGQPYQSATVKGLRAQLVAITAARDEACIASARSTVPLLADAVEKLVAENERLKARAHHDCDDPDCQRCFHLGPLLVATKQQLAASQAEVQRITTVELDFRDRLLTAVADDLEQQLAAMTEARDEALNAWESWVDTEGQYPAGESPENARIAELRLVGEKAK